MNLTPDGVRYATMGRGTTVCVPFHYRWLTPYLCKNKPVRWGVSAWTCSALTVLGVILLAHRSVPWPACLAAGLLWAGLPSVRFALSRPVLVDLPTIAVAVWAALATGNRWLVLPAAMLAGCVNERAPIFAALFAWSPLPLIGLAAVLVRHFVHNGHDPCDPTNRAIVEHPIRSARAFHAGKWRDPLLMVLPWGGCLAALGALDVQLVAVLVFAYLQLTVATDSVRLYQQAAPVVCVAAVTVCPPVLLPALLVGHWFNPFSGDGV